MALILRGSLFRKYVVFFVALVSLALIASGGVQLYFTYQENKQALLALQQEKADSAASRIETYVQEIARQLAWVRLAIRMHAAFAERVTQWQRRGFDLQIGVGVGVGVAQGYATVGVIGFEGRFDYGAIGAVSNLSARLCAEAKAGQTLVQRRVLNRVEDTVEWEAVGDLVMKGIPRPVEAFNVLRLQDQKVVHRG